MSEMSQAQAPAGDSGSMDPTEDVVPGGADDIDSDNPTGDVEFDDAGEDPNADRPGGGSGDLSDGTEPSEADMPGAFGAEGKESASDPMPDIAGTGS